MSTEDPEDPNDPGNFPAFSYQSRPAEGHGFRPDVPQHLRPVFRLAAARQGDARVAYRLLDVVGLPEQKLLSMVWYEPEDAFGRPHSYAAHVVVAPARWVSHEREPLRILAGLAGAPVARTPVQRGPTEVDLLAELLRHLSTGRRLFIQSEQDVTGLIEDLVAGLPPALRGRLTYDLAAGEADLGAQVTVSATLRGFVQGEHWSVLDLRRRSGMALGSAHGGHRDLARRVLEKTSQSTLRPGRLGLQRLAGCSWDRAIPTWETFEGLCVDDPGSTVRETVRDVIAVYGASAGRPLRHYLGPFLRSGRPGQALGALMELTLAGWRLPPAETRRVLGTWQRAHGLDMFHETRDGFRALLGVPGIDEDRARLAQALGLVREEACARAFVRKRELDLEGVRRGVIGRVVEDLSMFERIGATGEFCRALDAAGAGIVYRVAATWDREVEADRARRKAAEEAARRARESALRPVRAWEYWLDRGLLLLVVVIAAAILVLGTGCSRVGTLREEQGVEVETDELGECAYQSGAITLSDDGVSLELTEVQPTRERSVVSAHHEVSTWQPMLAFGRLLAAGVGTMGWPLVLMFHKKPLEVFAGYNVVDAYGEPRREIRKQYSDWRASSPRRRPLSVPTVFLRPSGGPPSVLHVAQDTGRVKIRIRPTQYWSDQARAGQDVPVTVQFPAPQGKIGECTAALPAPLVAEAFQRAHARGVGELPPAQAVVATVDVAGTDALRAEQIRTVRVTLRNVGSNDTAAAWLRLRLPGQDAEPTFALPQLAPGQETVFESELALAYSLEPAVVTVTALLEGARARRTLCAQQFQVLPLPPPRFRVTPALRGKELLLAVQNEGGPAGPVDLEVLSAQGLDPALETKLVASRRLEHLGQEPARITIELPGAQSTLTVVSLRDRRAGTSVLYHLRTASLPQSIAEGYDSPPVVLRRVTPIRDAETQVGFRWELSLRDAEGLVRAQALSGDRVEHASLQAAPETTAQRMDLAFNLHPASDGDLVVLVEVTDAAGRTHQEKISVTHRGRKRLVLIAGGGMEDLARAWEGIYKDLRTDRRPKTIRIPDLGDSGLGRESLAALGDLDGGDEVLFLIGPEARISPLGLRAALVQLERPRVLAVLGLNRAFHESEWEETTRALARKVLIGGRPVLGKALAATLPARPFTAQSWWTAADALLAKGNTYSQLGGDAATPLGVSSRLEKR